MKNPRRNAINKPQCHSCNLRFVVAVEEGVHLTHIFCIVFVVHTHQITSLKQLSLLSSLENDDRHQQAHLPGAPLVHSQSRPSVIQMRQGTSDFLSKNVIFFIIFAEKIFFLKNIYGFTPAKKRIIRFGPKMSKSQAITFKDLFNS